MTWFHLNGLAGQWRPFVMGIHGDTERVPYLECHKPYLSDIAIDLDTKFTKKESASYASWPIQAYIKGFSISSSLALSFTHNEEWTFKKCESPGNVHYFYPFTLEALGEVTLKINGGTVRAHVDEIEAGRSYPQFERNLGRGGRLMRDSQLSAFLCFRLCFWAVFYVDSLSFGSSFV